MKWIHSGMAGGGVLTIQQVIPNKHIFQAEMKWPNDPDIVHSSIHTTAIGCLEDLNNRLAANYTEQQKKGEGK